MVDKLRNQQRAGGESLGGPGAEARPIMAHGTRQLGW